MITKNFKARVATLLQMSSTTGSPTALVPVKGINGSVAYASCYSSNNFPHSVTTSVSFSSSSPGIHVGTGDTAATEDDYKLETQITSGMSAGSATPTYNVDGSGNPYLEYLFTLTNTTSSDIVVREIGYVQSLRVANTQGGSANTSAYFLFDRTVLDTPVTVPANDSAAIKYRLKTVLASS